jgi:regulatory protein
VSGQGADGGESPGRDASRPGRPSRRERPPAPAYQRALGLLVRREHSATELKRKLRGKGVDVDELDAALEILQRQGFQDDRRYAEALVRSRALAGQGPVRVRAELRQNGVPAADIDAAFESAETAGLDWDATAARVAARFLPALRAARGPDGQKQRHKAVSFLLRRGFSQGQARQALALHTDDGADDFSVD